MLSVYLDNVTRNTDERFQALAYIQDCISMRDITFKETFICVDSLDWLQSFEKKFINVSYHILVASLTLMALYRAIRVRATSIYLYYTGTIVSFHIILNAHVVLLPLICHMLYPSLYPYDIVCLPGHHIRKVL